MRTGAQLVEEMMCGSPIVCFDQVASTQDIAKAFVLEGGFPVGTVVMADSQTAGRGRLGRLWESPPGKNLYFSFTFRPNSSEVSGIECLSLVVGMVVARALSVFVGCVPQIKWPNDVYLNGRKACGIKVESCRTSADSEPLVVIGIGINVNAGERDFSPELRERATSLSLETGKTYDRLDVLRRVLDELNAFLANGLTPPVWKRTVEFVNDHLFQKEKRISYETPDGTRSGMGLHVSQEGYLVIRADDGSIMEINVGDVNVIERDYAAC